MKTQIVSIGDNLGISLPANILNEFRLENGSKVDVKVLKNKIEITSIIDIHKELSLEEMLINITQNNIHSEIDTHHSVGNEVW